MIYVVSGKLGVGKSLHITRLSKDHLNRGGVVATNMTLYPDKISSLYHRTLKPWQYIRIDASDDPHKIPRGDFRGSSSSPRRVMVVLDEALNWFASQAGAKDDRKATWLEWLRQSDKLGQDVYFIAQNFERAAKWIRELAQVCLNVTAFKHLTFLRLPIGHLPCLRDLYGVSRYDVQNQVCIGWGLYNYDKRLYQCYKTAELYGFEASDNAYVGTVAPPFHLPFVPFLIPLFLFLLGVFYAARTP